jgi:acyl-coenzyme A synthetase/AMP-(fatty) acid ligase
MSLELYLSVCAVMRLGAIAVFLDVWSTNQLGACARQAEAKAMISAEVVFNAFRPRLVCP